MGFLNVVGRMIQGKPAFEASNPASAPTVNQPQPETDPLVDARGRKVIPEIRLEHCKAYINGKTMKVSVWATNTSELEVMLDKIVLLGQKGELDHWLKPREGHEITLYNGPIPQNDNYHTANLTYKLVESGDYFQADFTIEYTLQSNGDFVVEEFHPLRPIRDI